MRKIAWVGVSLLCALARPAHAGARPILELNGGWSVYSMSEFDESVATFNASNAPLHLDEIRDGGTYGAGIAIAFPSGARVGIAYQRLTGWTSLSNPPVSLAFDLPANDFTATGRYAFKSGRRARGLVGGSIGVVSAAGRVGLSVAGVGSDIVHLTGMGPSFEMLGGVEYDIRPPFAIVTETGFHYAKISGIRANGTTSNPSLDYSGMFLRAGLEVGLAR